LRASCFMTHVLPGFPCPFPMISAQLAVQKSS
jgi:hypothetical protein